LKGIIKMEKINREVALYQRDLLMIALENVLVANGVISKEMEPTGPELLLAAQEYIKSKNRKE